MQKGIGNVSLWIVGGICVGFGILLMIGGFGDTGFGLTGPTGSIDPAAVSFKSFGYDASMDVGLSSTGKMGLPLIFIGIALMVYKNATAWKDTNGEY